jgi:ABC-type molybdenum transport system ATPase subunit/photorepair protein PhrA
MNPNPPAPAAHDDAVVIDGVGKRFEIYPNDRSRFFELIGSRTHHTDHWALRDLSFRVPRGRAFGVIGANGALTGYASGLPLKARLLRHEGVLL